MKAVNLRTNHMVNPVGIDGARLFLSWTCEGGIRQSAYRIVITKAENSRTKKMGDSASVLWDSGRVETDDMHLTCPVSFGSRVRAQWTAQLWDENGVSEEVAEAAVFETGLSEEDWAAQWVNPELTRLTAETYDCADAINAFAKANWERKAGEAQQGGSSPANYAAMAAGAGVAAAQGAKSAAPGMAGMAAGAGGMAGLAAKAGMGGMSAGAASMGGMDAMKAMAGQKAAEPKVYEPHQPASYLRKHFAADLSGIGQARLYITARGLYVAWLNGVRVGDAVLAPGSFTADRHLGVQTFDVTSLLRDGDNELRIALGDGWQRSTSGVDGDRNLFGEDLGVLFQLEADGKVLCFSDGEMEASQSGPIRQNDMQQGEVYDARLEEIAGWHAVKVTGPAVPEAVLSGSSAEEGRNPDSSPAAGEAEGKAGTSRTEYTHLIGMNSVPVREHETFEGRLFTAPDGALVLDFGQNLAGYIEIIVQAHEGQRILLTCGEALDADGNFTNENFQDRKRHKEGGTLQTLQLICREGVNAYKPSFTIMGFRYAKLESDLTKEELANARFTAIAVYSDMAQTAWFECSDADVNHLFRNSIWSQKGNFCDVPTDCPTRERAAWTGDMGVFVNTGLDLMDCYPVIEKWLGECRLNQYPDGRIPNIAPPNSHGSFMTALLCSSAGWGDACILVPYALYQRTGDPKILEDNYDMMKRWYAFLKGRAAQTTPEQESGPYAKYTVLNGVDYGEWCEPGISSIMAMANPRKSVGTAYLTHSGALLSEIADILGHGDEAEQFGQDSDMARLAFRHAFTEDGVIHSDRQCEYVRAISFGLLSGEEAQAAADTLNQMVIDNGYHLNTGFLSTPYLCRVLSEYGHTDTAYRLLLQDTAPGWLYAVKKGATTIWETWNGIDEDGNPHESLNHYSYGAVSGWLVEGVCGIRIAGKKLTIAPTPNPLLSCAKAVLESPLGRIESGWRYETDSDKVSENGSTRGESAGCIGEEQESAISGGTGCRIVYEFTIPANVRADVVLPGGHREVLGPGRSCLTERTDEGTFLYFCDTDKVDRAEAVTQIRVRSNLPEVSLYKDGHLAAAKRGKDLFRFDIPIEGEHSIEARAEGPDGSERRSVMLIRRV